MSTDARDFEPPARRQLARLYAALAGPGPAPTLVLTRFVVLRVLGLVYLAPTPPRPTTAPCGAPAPSAASPATPPADPHILGLMAPPLAFVGGAPTFVRVDVYHYRFTAPGEPGWWHRERLGNLIRTVSRDDPELRALLDEAY